jgi:hypothetical protein
MMTVGRCESAARLSADSDDALFSDVQVALSTAAVEFSTTTPRTASVLARTRKDLTIMFSFGTTHGPLEAS